jgi:hypothetical protein
MKRMSFELPFGLDVLERYEKMQYGYEVERFKEACKMYEIYLKKHIEETIMKHLTDIEQGKKLFSHFLRVFMPFPYHNEICFKGIRGNILHYAPYDTTNGYDWTKRHFDIWKKLKITPPFVRVQNELAKKQYYIYDISDPRLSHQTYVVVFIGRPMVGKKSEIKLWHNFNIIHRIDEYEFVPAEPTV